jgi:hypothetical protein
MSIGGYFTFTFNAGARPRRGGEGVEVGLLGCSHTQIQIKKRKTCIFVDRIISTVLRDLTVSRNRPLKSSDDSYIEIPKKK